MLACIIGICVPLCSCASYMLRNGSMRSGCWLLLMSLQPLSSALIHAHGACRQLGVCYLTTCSSYFFSALWIARSSTYAYLYAACRTAAAPFLDHAYRTVKCPYSLLTAVYQAGQPRWTVSTQEAAPGQPPPPMLHLSYHDGQHYNSVRMADDFGHGPPAPIVLRPVAVSEVGA